MTESSRRSSVALALSMAALAVAVGGTAIVARGGGGGGGGATGMIVAYAQILADGDVVESKSLNITDGRVRRQSTATFCFRNLPFNWKGAQVTIDLKGTDHDTQAAVLRGNPFGD